MKKLFSFLFLLFFTMLYATNVGVGTPQPTNVLPILVEGGEPFENRSDFDIPSRSPVQAVAISSDGKTIVLASSDGSVKEWHKNKKIGKIDGKKSMWQEGKVHGLSLFATLFGKIF